MLAQLLEQAGYTTLTFPLDTSVPHSVDLVAPDEKDVLFISALPPFAFARARTLGLQLKARFPRTRLMIGVWGFTGDAEKARRRFEPAPPDQLVTSLADAVRFVVPADASIPAGARV
jgi:hypothetical protein